MKIGHIVTPDGGASRKRMKWRGMTGPDDKGRYWATLEPTSKSGKKKRESRVLECDARGLPHGYKLERKTPNLKETK